MINKYCQKHKKKLQKKQARDFSFIKKKKQNAKNCSRQILKSFWRRKKRKERQFYQERNNNLSEEEKGKTVEYEKFLFST